MNFKQWQIDKALSLDECLSADEYRIEVECSDYSESDEGLLVDVDTKEFYTWTEFVSWYKGA